MKYDTTLFLFPSALFLGSAIPSIDAFAVGGVSTRINGLSTSALAMTTNNNNNRHPENDDEYRRRRRNENINQAFADLEAEMRGGDSSWSSSSSPVPPFGFKLDPDTIRRQQEWVNKAFGVAEEFAGNFVSEAARGDVRQQQEFVNKAIFGALNDKTTTATTTTTGPGVVFRNDKDAFVITLDVPGVRERDIEIDLYDTGVLNIRGKRYIDGSTNDKSFNRSFRVGEDIVPDSITASLRDGVLTVRVPLKVEEEEEVPKNVRRVPIS